MTSHSNGPLGLIPDTVPGRRAAFLLDLMGDREWTISELYEHVPVRVCPGWAEYDDMGILDPETGGRGIREWSWQSTYQALELLRLLGHAERRQERGRRASKNRAVSVYFRTPPALTGVIAELDGAVRS